MFTQLYTESVYKLCAQREGKLSKAFLQTQRPDIKALQLNPTYVLRQINTLESLHDLPAAIPK